MKWRQKLDENQKKYIKLGTLLKEEVKLELNPLNNLEFITSCYHRKFTDGIAVSP